MKKNAPNLLNNLQNNWLSPKHLHLITTKCVLLIAFMFFSVSLRAQISSITIDDTSPQIMEVDSYLALLKKTEKTSKSATSNSKNLEHLLKDVQPSYYVTNMGLKKYGEQPNSLYVDSNSLSSIKSSNFNTNNIEIVTIKINSNSDLKRSIDLSVFSNYTKLKYIYIVSNVQTTELEIINLVKNNTLNYSVFYKIDKGA